MADRKKLDLRKQPPQPAAPAAPTPIAGIPRGAPGPGMLKPGQVLDSRYMTAFEKKQLASIGWEEGTPVPGNAAELIAAIQAEATAEGLLPVSPDTPPLTMPEPIDISKLPAAKQKELHDALAKASSMGTQFREQQAATAGMSPGIAQAMRVADDVAKRNSPGSGFSVVDDRPRTATKSKPTSWPGPEPPAAPPPEPPPISPPIGELSSTGAAGITHCPHCSWDLKRTDPTNPSDDDKRIYLMAALGGPGHRFTHVASLLGGSVKVGYRELTGNEADAALTQIADDVRKGRVVGDGEWWQRLMDYRMTQAIDYIDIQGVGRVYEGVDLDDIESDDGNPTVYPALNGHLLTNVLHSESIRRGRSGLHAVSATV